jgi:hypothetical protein
MVFGPSVSGFKLNNKNYFVKNKKDMERMYIEARKEKDYISAATLLLLAFKEYKKTQDYKNEIIGRDENWMYLEDVQDLKKICNKRYIPGIAKKMEKFKFLPNQIQRKIFPVNSIIITKSSSYIVIPDQLINGYQVFAKIDKIVKPSPKP